MKADHSVQVNEFGFYCVPDAFANRTIPDLLARGEVYEPNTLRLIRRWVGTGDVISGGAFIGDFFPAISQALSDDARLHSFEPNPLSFEAAQRTIALNGLKNVVLDQVAVGDAVGRLHLQLARKPDGVATAARATIVTNSTDGETIEVDVTTLDELVPQSRRISVLHLDVEGQEKPALSGGRRIIEANRPMIVLEAEKPWKVRMYQSYLEDLFPDASYKIAGHMERNAFFLPNQHGMSPIS